MQPEAQTLLLKDWPYQPVSIALIIYQREHGKNPASLWVGSALWKILRDASDAEEFYAVGQFLIRWESFGMLEPHEFMFTA
jgi:hypothetical protein